MFNSHCIVWLCKWSLTNHGKREHLWCCISWSYRGNWYSQSWDLDVQIVISWSLPSSLWGGFLCICVIGTSKPLVVINYPKTFQSLFEFHKEVSWDPYSSLCISTSYLLLLNSLRHHCMLTILFFTALQKNLASKRASWMQISTT